MQTVEVTWMYALKVWWSITWRTALYALIAAIPLATLWGVLAALQGIGDAQIEAYSQLGGSLLALPAGVVAVRVVLTRQFRRYRLALLPSEEALLEGVVHRHPSGEESP